MSDIDWKRPLDEVLGDDATARRQLAEHAQLLPIADARTSLRFITARLREHWVSALATLLITIGGAVAAAFLPRLIGAAVDVVVDGESKDQVWMLGGQILGVGILQAVLMALGWAMISALGQRILAGMREDVIDRALDLPAQTMERTGIGDALSRVADDVDVAARAVNNLVPNLIQLGFLVVITLVGMATLSPWLLLMVVIIVPMYVLAATWYLRRTAPIYRRERIAMGARAQGLLSAIHGIPTVHAYGIERRETRHVAVLSETASVLNMRVMYLVSRLVMGLNVPENLALAMVLLLGFVMVQVGGAPIGLVTAAAIYLVTLFWPMMSVIFNLDEVQSALASLARMVGVITSIDPAASPRHRTPRRRIDPARAGLPCVHLRRGGRRTDHPAAAGPGHRLRGDDLAGGCLRCRQVHARRDPRRHPRAAPRPGSPRRCGPRARRPRGDEVPRLDREPGRPRVPRDAAGGPEARGRGGE